MVTYCRLLLRRERERQQRSVDTAGAPSAADAAAGAVAGAAAGAVIDGAAGAGAVVRRSRHRQPLILLLLAIPLRWFCPHSSLCPASKQAGKQTSKQPVSRATHASRNKCRREDGVGAGEGSKESRQE